MPIELMKALEDKNCQPWHRFTQLLSHGSDEQRRQKKTTEKRRATEGQTKDKIQQMEKILVCCRKAGDAEQTLQQMTVMMVIITITQKLKTDIHRQTPVVVTFPFALVYCQVSVKLHKTPHLVISNYLTTQITTLRLHESMPSMCIVNKAGEIGLIIYTTYDLQSNTICLGERWGQT